MRQAYDYWQDQPGSCVKPTWVPGEPEQPRRTSAEAGSVCSTVSGDAPEGAAVSSVAHLTDSPGHTNDPKDDWRTQSLSARYPITPSTPRRAPEGPLTRSIPRQDASNRLHMRVSIQASPRCLPLGRAFARLASSRAVVDQLTVAAVSYTHLTLPTIYSV